MKKTTRKGKKSRKKAGHSTTKSTFTMSTVFSLEFTRKGKNQQKKGGNSTTKNNMISAALTILSIFADAISVFGFFGSA